jgi:hypothetical protein
MPFSALVQHPDFRLATSGSLVLAHFTGPLSSAALEEVEARLVAVVRRFRHASLALALEGQETRVGPAEREQLTAMLKRLEPHLSGQATAVLLRGAAGAVLRTSLSGMHWLMRSRAPMKVFDEVGAAVQWLGTLPGQPPAIAQAADAARSFVVGPQARAA